MNTRSIFHKLLILTLCFILALSNNDTNKTENITYEEDENGIVILNDVNFQDVVDSFDYLLIEFYSPKSKRCKEFETIYNEIAQQLKEEKSKMRLAKIDIVDNPLTAESLRIHGLPTILFRYKDVLVEYDNAPKKELLLNYINNVLTIPYTVYTTINEVEQHISNHSRSVISTFTETNKEGLELIKKASIVNTLIEWINCNSQECIEHYKENTLRLYLQLNKTEFVYPEKLSLTFDSLNYFLEKYSVGTLAPIDVYTMNILIKFNRPVFFYFRQHFENEDKVIDIIREAEKKHRDNYLFLIVDRKNEKDGDRDFIYFFEITDHELPRFQLVNFKGSIPEYDNYCMNQEVVPNMTLQMIDEFINDYENGELFKEPLSERIPPEGIFFEGYERIVSKTFYKKLVYSDITYMMIFVDDKCEEEKKCEELIDLWRTLGEKYNERPENVRFGLINMSHNEIYQLNIIERYPMIFLYLKGNKNDPIEYEGAWQKDDIEKWLAKWVEWEKVPEDQPKEQNIAEDDDDDDDGDDGGVIVEEKEIPIENLNEVLGEL